MKFIENANKKEYVRVCSKKPKNSLAQSARYFILIHFLRSLMCLLIVFNGEGVITSFKFVKGSFHRYFEILLSEIIVDILCSRIVSERNLPSFRL